MSETNLLGQYLSMVDFQKALFRIDQRLSARLRAKETASQYMAHVVEGYDDLSDGFKEFFPQLAKHFRKHQLGSDFNHYLR